MELRVKELCKQKGITLKELAARMGVTDISLRQTLAGNPTLKTMKRVAEVLGVETYELLKDPAPYTARCPNCGQLVSVEFRMKKL